VKHLVVFCSIAIALLASFPAAAQGGPGGRRFGHAGPPRQPPPQRVPVRDATADQRNANPMRLTPEQRQQLRRDIHDHGRDIYRDRGEAPRRR